MYKEKSKMNPKINQADMDISDMQLERLSCRSIKNGKDHTTTYTTMIFKNIRWNIFTSALTLNKCIDNTDAIKFDWHINKDWLPECMNTITYLNYYVD